MYTEMHIRDYDVTYFLDIREDTILESLGIVLT